MEETSVKHSADAIDLKGALHQLKISEECYRIAAETSSEIIFDYYLQDNSISHATNRIEALYGVPQLVKDAPEYLVTSGVVLPESAHDFLAVFHKIQRGETRAECVIRTRTLTGGVFWNSMVLTTVFGDEPKPTKAVGILRDITLEKEAGLQYENDRLFHTATSRDSFLFVEHVFRILHESQDLCLATNAILELVAKHFGYCRGYIYEVFEDGSCHNTFDWHPPEAQPLPDALKAFDADAAASYASRFDEDGLYSVHSMQQVTPSMRNLMEELGIKSLLQYKLFSNGRFQGFIGFDRDCLEQVPVADNPSILQVIAQTLYVFLSEKHVNDELAESSKILQVLSDNLDTCSYIVDLDTFILRFVNAKTMELVPGAEPGAICHKVIRGFDAPCADCPLLIMRKNNTKRHQTEIYNESLNLWTKVDASLVDLADHMEYGLLNCYDITEYKNRDGEYIVDAHAFTSDFTLYDALCRSTDDYIYMCDMAKNLFYFSQNMVDDFSLPSRLIENASVLWGALIHEDERQDFFDAFQDLVDGKTNVHCQDYRAMNKDGNWVWLRCRGYLEHNAAGAPTIFAGIITNLAKKSKVDHVSGLPNKYMFEGHVRSQLAGQLPGWLMLLGLDNFKHINNLYGLEFGDHVIRITAERLQTLLPPQLQVFRLDGDVFGVLVPQKDLQELELIYGMIQTAFHQQQEFDGHRYTCTLSAGCTNLMGGTNNFEALFKQAEYALEYAKSEGKNRLSFYNAEAMSGRERALTLIELLRESVEQNFKNFELFFQPQVHADTHEVVSAEALLRWQCAEFGAISPVEFIPLLEQTGMIRPVGHWVLSQAADVCLEWRKIRPDFSVSVNLSYLQLLEKNFIPQLTSNLKAKGLDASALHLELTESRIADGSRSLSLAFDELRKLGFCLEMDDFGTGYSSLEILKNKPADIVKIDRAFVKDINRSDFDATFIRFVVSLCHSVGIRVCLEGVESWEEYALVKPMGLDTIQGFLFGKPECKASFETRHFNVTQR